MDPAKLNTLKELVNGPNFKDNIGILIKTIYEFAYATYAGGFDSHSELEKKDRHKFVLPYDSPDLPRGEIKNNSMRKLAAKTLLEILPAEVAADVHAKLAESHRQQDGDGGSHAAGEASHNVADFVTLVGLVSFHGKD